jgi:hypothetical protein
MLILSRKQRESVVVGGGSGLDRLLKVTVLEIVGGKVKLGFEADGENELELANGARRYRFVRTIPVRELTFHA